AGAILARSAEEAPSHRLSASLRLGASSFLDCDLLAQALEAAFEAEVDRRTVRDQELHSFDRRRQFATRGHRLDPYGSDDLEQPLSQADPHLGTVQGVPLPLDEVPDSIQ